MKESSLLDAYKRIIIYKNIMLVGLISSIIINIILSIGFVIKKDNSMTILISPITDEKFVIYKDKIIDENYFRFISDSVFKLFSDVSPLTVDYNYSKLMFYVDLKGFNQIKDFLESESKAIKEKKITTRFDIKETKVDICKLTCLYNGILHISFGKDIFNKQFSYKFTYSYNNGRTYLSKIEKEEIDEKQINN